jgi:hypothetical protein
MSSLTLFYSSGSMPLLALPTTFFLIAEIATMWYFLKQKISDEITVLKDLSSHVKKITNEIGKINPHDDVLIKEAQKILSMVNNITTRLNTIKEACRNDFTAINASIENL